MSNLRVQMATAGRAIELQEEINEYLKITDKEIVDIKLAHSGSYMYAMIIEKVKEEE